MCQKKLSRLKPTRLKGSILIRAVVVGRPCSCWFHTATLARLRKKTPEMRVLCARQMKSLTHHFDLQGNLRQPNGMEVVFASYEETERNNFRRRSNYSADLWLFLFPSFLQSCRFRIRTLVACGCAVFFALCVASARLTRAKGFESHESNSTHTHSSSSSSSRERAQSSRDRANKKEPDQARSSISTKGLVSTAYLRYMYSTSRGLVAAFFC